MDDNYTIIDFIESPIFFVLVGLGVGVLVSVCSLSYIYRENEFVNVKNLLHPNVLHCGCSSMNDIVIEKHVCENKMDPEIVYVPIDIQKYHNT